MVNQSIFKSLDISIDFDSSGESIENLKRDLIKHLPYKDFATVSSKISYLIKFDIDDGFNDKFLVSSTKNLQKTIKQSGLFELFNPNFISERTIRDITFKLDTGNARYIIFPPRTLNNENVHQVLILSDMSYSWDLSDNEEFWRFEPNTTNTQKGDDPNMIKNCMIREVGNWWKRDTVRHKRTYPTISLWLQLDEANESVVKKTLYNFLLTSDLKLELPHVEIVEAEKELAKTIYKYTPIKNNVLGDKHLWFCMAYSEMLLSQTKYEQRITKTKHIDINTKFNRCIRTAIGKKGKTVKAKIKAYEEQEKAQEKIKEVYEETINNGRSWKALISTIVILNAINEIATGSNYSDEIRDSIKHYLEVERRCQQRIARNGIYKSKFNRRRKNITNTNIADC